MKISKIVVISLIMCFMLSGAVMASDSQNPALSINGSAVKSDIQPIVINNQAFIPLNIISDYLGCTANYKDGQISITTSGAGNSSASSPAAAAPGASAPSASTSDAHNEPWQYSY